MQLEEVTAEIRPRSDWEAVDLGFAMVRRDFWRCFSVWWLAMALPLAIAGALLWKHPVLLLCLFWWFKPAGSRMVLFELSRRLFGEKPPWRAVWRELPRAWWRRFFYRFFWARLSPWLPVTLAVEDLEGLRGKPYKQRCQQVVRRGEGVIMWLFLTADLAALWTGMGVLGTVIMLIPGDGVWNDALEMYNPDFPLEIPLVISRTVIACVMLALSLTDILAIGAGFGIYINNRTWIEGWDVELAFKRMAKRLEIVALVLLTFCLLGNPARAAESQSPQETIHEVKSHKDFTVHTVTERVPKDKPSPKKSAPAPWLAQLGDLMLICIIALLLGFLGWAIWKNRHAFLIRGGRGGGAQPAKPSARVVMGMEISADTLPDDIPGTALRLWREGRRHEALALLYRGSISRAMDSGRVEIHESDTEGDCLRRVERAGAAAHPDYFRGLTGVWVRLAYAGISPGDDEVGALCHDWPFGRGGAA